MRPHASLVLLAASAAAAFALAAAPPASALETSSYGMPLMSRLGASDGLPNASVSSIVQDDLGFIWFGTQGGLVRYDGYSFKRFNHEPFDTESLPIDIIQTLFIDDRGLWVGTYAGLARMDPLTERFTSYASVPGDPSSLSGEVVTSIARDGRGSLWVGTLSGLNRLDEATGKFQRFLHDPKDPSSLPCDIVRAIKADREGRLWIGTSGGGLARFNYAQANFVTYKRESESESRRLSIPSNYVMAIEEDPRGRLWIGTWGTASGGAGGGFSLFDPSSGHFESHPTADGRVYALCAAEDGILYAGTWGGGLFEYDIEAKRFLRYNASSAPGSLSSDIVYSFLKDKAGELWIGTNGGGLCKLGASRRGYEAIAAGEDGIAPGKVYAVLVDRLGWLWVGTYNGGLSKRDPETGVWRRYRHADGDKRSLPHDTIDFLREDEDGTLWIGTNDGLARYDRGSDSFVTMRPKEGNSDLDNSAMIYDMLGDPAGGLWLGVFRQGLGYWDRSRGTYAIYSHDPARSDSLSDDLVSSLGRDASGRLWVGTNHGLNRLEGSAPASGGAAGGGGGRFARYLYDPKKPGGVSSDVINTIFLDSRKVLWIGTSGGGLMRYEGETDSFVSYTMRDGLPSNTVSRILEDGEGDLWIATQTGLAIYDRAGGRIRSLSVSQDVEGAEFFSGAYRAADGSLFFGALSKVYRFDPARYEFNGYRPPIVFTSIAVKGQPLVGAAAYGAARGEGPSSPRLDLSWRDNSISFEFAALDYRDSKRNLYSSKLEGFDEQWSPVGPSHSATYTNLPGGNYLFRVRASNNDGLWNDEGVSLPIKVRRRPWTSPLALAAYAILVACGGYFLAFFLSRTSLYAARAEADGLRARLVQASASMESAAIVDALTGLPNRRKAEEHLELAFSRAAASKLDLGLLLVDLDRFKSYNDRYGRAAGDECLRRVAAALCASVEGLPAVVARYGGEELLVVLEETDIAGALAAGEAARKAVEALAIPRGNDRAGEVVTVSVGCASAQPESSMSPATLVAAAERALMAAKLRGRNRASS